MKNSAMRGPGFRFTAGRAGAASALLLMIGGMAMSPAFADHGRGHGDHGDRGDRGGYDRGYDRGHGHWRHGYDRHDWRGGPAYEPYPVYAPAPVYYPPEPSAGVSLFFPIHIR